MEAALGSVNIPTMPKSKIICFDIDGTLIKGNSWLLLTEGMGCSVVKHAELYQDTVSGKITFEESERELVGIWRDSGNATRKKLKQIYDKVEVRKGVKELFDFLRDKGFLIYLVSGSNEFFVEGIASRLKPDGYYSNAEITFDSEGVIDRINQRINEQAQVKVEQVTEIAKKNGVSIEDIYFVGDGENDIDIFIATGKGLSVHSSNEYLKEIAYKNLETLDDIKRLFP